MRSSLEGAAMFGANMKTRCDNCCGPFGLVRRRYFDHQFCCEACEEAYKEQRAKIAAQFKSGFYQSLSDNR
jgi:predicted nucleic acid-binding Zn ribbon protein